MISSQRYTRSFFFFLPINVKFIEIIVAQVIVCKETQKK